MPAIFEARQCESPGEFPETQARPVVIVGTGPVGIRVAQQLLERNPGLPVVLYGDEPWEPYDRIRLSSLLRGETDRESLNNPLEIPRNARVLQHHNCAVVAIDTANRKITDAIGRQQPYENLIMAVGSRPHWPNIPGIDKPGVYSFRDMSDTERLVARSARSRHTIVLGGGLLGLEAARGLQRAGTRITVIEHADRLMAAQLDEPGAESLCNRVTELGIQVKTGTSVVEIQGEQKVIGVRLRDGSSLSCDTLVVATGIRPNIELAREAGLHVGRGIKVDDALQTSDPYVFAVGECVEHDGKIYGLVGPGYEQAAVLAERLTGGDAVYQGSVSSSRLKVVGETVFSVGVTGEGQSSAFFGTASWEDKTRGHYRKIIYRFNRIIGAMGVGDWPESSRIQEAVESQRRVWPWQLAQFRRNGRLWAAEDAADVAVWPAHARVCNCKSVTRGTLTDAIEDGCLTLDGLATRTGAATVCGSCKPLLVELLGNAILEPEPGSRTLVISAVIAMIISLAFLVMPNIPYNSSIMQPLQWDLLWRDGLLKQITGFGLLGLGILISLISLRKRIEKFALGGFSGWRVVHVIAGVMTVMLLVAHTGLRVGSNINWLLMMSFIALMLLGSAASWMIGRQHVLPRSVGGKLRKLALWGHIMLLWPVPALLGFHVLKTYWY